MTQPRMLVAGRTYLVTRRVRDRTHLFRPDAAISRVFLYCLFVCASQLGIEVHAAMLMSNHLHLVVTDPTGRLSVFLCRFHALLARCTQALRDWRGTVFEDTECSVVALRSPQAIIEKIAYVVGNPVEAQLVEYARDWPGVSGWQSKAKRRWPQVLKPTVYFRKNNHRYPPAVLPVFSLPKELLVTYGDAATRRAINDEIRRIERGARWERSKSGRKVVGVDRVCRGSTRERAKSSAPPISLNPNFAVGRGQRALYTLVATELKAFRDAYRKAFSQWRKGDREVCFPPGTFWMVYVHGANPTH